MTDKPPFNDFGEWARGTLGFDVDAKAVQTWIKTNVEGARSQIQQHPIIPLIEKFIAEKQASARRSTINVVGRDLQLHSKSYDSILSKLYRTNVLNNRKFPAPPRGGWVKLQNMFGKLNDLVRSKIVCRHINEPAMIAQEILKLAQSNNLKASGRAQTKDEGYYAHHIYLSVPVRLVNQQWQEFDESVRFEIQITTEMQNMLYELTHTFYDKERHVVPKDPHSWKWDYRSARFSASYLSHTLHLVEGMILQLYEDIEREKQAAALAIENVDTDHVKADPVASHDPTVVELVELPGPEHQTDAADQSFGAEDKS